MSPPDVASAVAARPAGRPPLIDQYRLMLLIRAFEERAATLFEQGVIFGTAHSCVGQEAIAVGAAGVMRETDYLVGHHRSHGHLIAAGADLQRMMAEMFGKRTGYCKGLGGSMHIADLSLDILGCNGIVGDVHRAAEPLAVTRPLAEHLRHHPPEIRAGCDEMAVRAVVSDEVVALPHDARRADCDRLLPDAAVCGADDHALLEELRCTLLEHADQEHQAVPVDERAPARRAGLHDVGHEAAAGGR